MPKKMTEDELFELFEKLASHMEWEQQHYEVPAIAYQHLGAHWRLDLRFSVVPSSK